MSVFVSTQQLTKDRVELVLEPAGGEVLRWSKIYDGPLFLSMDAQSLGLLEPIPGAPSSGPTFRLKRSGEVQPEHLAHMRFLETLDPTVREE